MRTLSRRGFLTTSGAALGALPLIRSVDALAQAANPVFRHGVASGDPLGDRVILWTRVTTPKPAAAVPVAWQIARDAKFTRVVARGELVTGPARDFTVKIDAGGLEPGTTYYYRFQAANAQSPLGRTRTLPAAGVSRLRIGVVSCSNLPFGYFNAYACLANRADLDVILHLGDYIYEYPNGQYGDGTAFNRIPMPDKEIIALQDYRDRHATYKLDPDSQEAHRQHPFIITWDDHEFANNSWSGGAQNHSPATEGDWWARRAAATQAFFEWMPIRDDGQALAPRVYRTFSFGDLATLYMLDTRMIGRDQQVLVKDVATIASPSRSLLGLAQEHWLAGELAASARSNTLWNLLGQQVMFAPQSAPDTVGANPDSWDGYRGARERMFDTIEQQQINNVVVLTGDVHSSWAYDLPRRPYDAGYDRKTGKGSLGVEFAGTSITSPSNLGVGPEGQKLLANVMAARPHLHYADGRYRGYFILDLTRERLQADFYGVATVQERSTKERFEKGFISESGGNHLVEASTPA